MAIPKHQSDNYNTLCEAIKAGDCALLECTNATTGKPEYVLCAVNTDGDGYELVPFARMLHDPYAEVVPPSMNDEETDA